MRHTGDLNVDVKLNDSVLNECDFFTALKNEDGTFRIVGTADVEIGNCEKCGAVVVVERATVRAETLSTGERTFKVLIPNEEKVSVSLVRKCVQDATDEETRGDT